MMMIYYMWVKPWLCLHPLPPAPPPPHTHQCCSGLGGFSSTFSPRWMFLLSANPPSFTASEVCHCPMKREDTSTSLEYLTSTINSNNVVVSVSWVSLLHPCLILRLRLRIKLYPRISITVRVGVMKSTICLMHTSARCFIPKICTVSWPILLQEY